jgi:hypothetical protein
MQGGYIMSSAHDCEVQDTVIIRLRSKSPKAFSAVSCECDHGTLHLRGHSSSYYEKQMAQEAVRGIDGVTQVINEIEVTPDSTQIPAISGPSHPVSVHLRSQDDSVPDVEFVASGSRVLVGRAEAADVHIEDECISRYHCEIAAINGTLWVRDLGSANGVLVNGFHETQSHLMPGDRLTIGETSFLVEYARHAPRSYEDVLP